MFRLFIISLIVVLLSSNAKADTYSDQEKVVIFSYPTQNGSLDWDELRTRFPDGETLPSNPLEFENLYAASIAAVRTGQFDVATSRARSLQAAANTPLWQARSNLLVGMIDFYQGDTAIRQTRSPSLRSDLKNLADADGAMDWIAGTTIALLLDFHLQELETDEARETLAVSEPLAPTLGDFEGHVWTANNTLKLAYTHALSSAPDRRQQAALQAGLAAHETGRALRFYQTDEEFDLIKRLYFRAVVFDAANRAHAGTEGIEVNAPGVPMYFDFYPEFQNTCVASHDFKDLSFRRRDYTATGGVVVKAEINAKGRGKFVSVVDGMPVSITQGGMLGQFKRQIGALRVTFEEDRPDWCDQGGEMYISLSYSWER
ncbi:MAG: hypothetical protein AAF768_12555 [Pseudomonadota bacterium]